VRLALRGEFVPYAVNVSAGAEVSEIVRPFVPLAERLGALLAGLAEGGVRSIVCSYMGRIAEADTRVLTLAILKGILGKVVNEPVSFVNAPMLARERGITVSEMRSTVSEDYVSLMSLRADTDEGPVSVAGTLVGKRDAERVMKVDDFRAHDLLHLRGQAGHHRDGRDHPRRPRREHRHDGRRSQG
jgi:D-3-phosphoglycerate dehydrogenase